MKNKVIYTIYYSIIFACGISLFMENSDILSAGITGIVQIINYFFQNIPFSIIYILINIPGLIISYFYIGNRFTILSLVSILTVSITTAIIPAVTDKVITTDPLLNCVFGGLLMGYGLGKLLKIGSSTGGTDFYGVAIHKYNGSSFAQVSTTINIFICFFAGAIFGMEMALFTMLSIIIRQLTVMNIYNNYNKVTIWVICDSEDISKKAGDYITIELGRSYTQINNCQGGFYQQDKIVLMSTLDYFEYKQIRKKLKNEKEMFITATQTISIFGTYPININD